MSAEAAAGTPEVTEPDPACVAPDAPADGMKSLQVFVGGYDALMRLDAEPLPNEDFDWSAVESRDATFVALVLMLVDDYCGQFLDHEYRTIAGRILARVVAHDPRVLRRSDNPDRFAAGLVWLAGRGSGRFGRRGGWPKASHLWRWFRVTNCADRGRSLQSAAGLCPDADLAWWLDPGELALGDAGLLHSRFRRDLVSQRDASLRYEAQREQRQREQRSPVVSHEGDRLVVAAMPIEVLGAAKALPVDGERLGICIVLGTELETAACYDLSIPDARKLVRCVQSALNDPPPRRER